MLNDLDHALPMGWRFQFFGQDWFPHFFSPFKNAELRDQIVSVQEEKKILAVELENLKSKLAEVIEEVCIWGLEGQTWGVVEVFGD